LKTLLLAAAAFGVAAVSGFPEATSGCAEPAEAGAAFGSAAGDELRERAKPAGLAAAAAALQAATQAFASAAFGFPAAALIGSASAAFSFAAAAFGFAAGLLLCSFHHFQHAWHQPW